MARHYFIRWLIGGALCFLAAAAIWYAFLRPEPAVTDSTPQTDGPERYEMPADPRLTYGGPFRNVHPAIRFIGDAGCISCHADICKSYHAHPMGRSAALLDGMTSLEKYDTSAKNPWTIGNYDFRVEKTPGGVLHRVSAKDSVGTKLPDYAIPASVAIGSGTRGRSYLTVDQGSVWQSPMSWFSKESRWDVSPGFDMGTGGRRAVVTDCLFCHVDRVEPIRQATNRYLEPLFPIQAAIGCERCHGAGEIHAQERALGKSQTKVDTSIVNPKHLSQALQASICEQCHLQGESRVARRGREPWDFRPGLSFDEFVRVFVRHPDIADMQRSVGQFEQLRLSRCSTPEGNSLQCTNCHNPHQAPAPADKEQYFRNQCVNCHQKKTCSAPMPERNAKADNCAACHMPKAGSSNISHTSITDHRILRRAEVTAPPRGLPKGTLPLVPFHPGSAPSDPELQRDLGIAMARAGRDLPGGSGTQKLMGRWALESLGSSRATWGGDAESWLAMARAQSLGGDPKERMAAAERAQRLSPDSETILSELAEAALGLGQYERAIEIATKLIGLNPKSVDYRLSRATTFTILKQWDKAEEDCRKTLEIQPLHPMAHLVLALCLHKRGDPEAGKREADTAIGLATQKQQKAAFREWFVRESH